MQRPRIKDVSTCRTVLVCVDKFPHIKWDKGMCKGKHERVICNVILKAYKANIIEL